MRVEQRSRVLVAARMSLRRLGWNLLRADGAKAFDAVAIHVGSHPNADPVVTQWYRMACENKVEQGEFFEAWYVWQQETRQELGLSRGW